MGPSGGAAPAGPPIRTDCPACGGPLGEPVSRDVHCTVDCAACGERYQLDDPRLAAGTTRGGRAG